MILPIRFPDEGDVIAEEAARFRALSPRARLQSLKGLIQTGVFLMRRSEKSAYIKEADAGSRSASRRSVREFIARYGR